MPRYFLHLHNHMYVEDEEGSVLPDLAAAYEEAIVNIRDLMSEDVRHGRLCLDNRIDVADESGTVLSSISFRDAVVIDGQVLAG